MKKLCVMKKTYALFLSILMVSCLSACGNRESLSKSDVLSAKSSTLLAESTEVLESEELQEAQNTEVSVSDTSEERNILIVYFSRFGNTDYPDDVDASTSASIVIDSNRYGTTEYVADMIRQNVGGDIHPIETVDPYTADFDELRDVNHNEMQQNYLPELKESNLELSKYDTVFIGYPVWATDVPQAVLSFLNQYDLSEKTVIPFCTHDGYGAGNSYQTIREVSKAERILDGLALEAKDVPVAQNTVLEWLTSIGISNLQENPIENGEIAIKVTIGSITLDGMLYHTALADEIMGKLPLTVSMVNYGGREYYGGVDFIPENTSSGKLNFENGDITYCSTNNTMAIFYSQTDQPNLTMEVIPVGKIISDLSIFDTLDNREEITFSLAE